MNNAELERLFIERFGGSSEPIRIFFAPGRVNLIGDHTDYNGGLVFPCAIHYGTTLLIRPTDKKNYQLASTNFDLFAVLSNDQVNQKYGDHWINYPLGVIQQFVNSGDGISGFECLYSGNVPNGAGLSSSASISVVTAFAINELYDCKRSLPDIIRMAQFAENDFVGVQCGVMDQYAVSMGQSNHAMMLDCETLECDQIPLELGDHTIVLINTNQRRELSESKYNERVTETLQALEILQQKYAVSELVQVTSQQLQDAKDLFGVNQEIVYRRARHVITENQRVKGAVVELRNSNLAGFGQLMLDSHVSLRDDYDVSSDPLNELVRIASEVEGVLGARLTGAGFGGCTVNLVHKDKIQLLTESVESVYTRSTGLTAEFHEISPAQGVREVTA